MGEGYDAYTSRHNIWQWSHQSSDPATKWINNLIRKQFWEILVVWVKGCLSEDWSTGKHMTWPFLQQPESMGRWSGKILVTWGRDEQCSPQHKTIDRQSISATARETHKKWEVSLTYTCVSAQTHAVRLRVKKSGAHRLRLIKHFEKPSQISWFFFQRNCVPLNLCCDRSHYTPFPTEWFLVLHKKEYPPFFSLWCPLGSTWSL